jgi:hypothetical protein
MTIHAAAESSQGTAKGTYAVALHAPDEQSLLELEDRLRYAGIPHSAFREPDPPYNNQLMSIGIEPTERRMVRRFLVGLPMIGE